MTSQTAAIGTASWTVRPFRADDVPGILRLFRRAFGKEVAEGEYRWKVVDTPRPVRAPTVWVAEAEGEIVGHYAGTCMQFRFGPDVLRVIHGCDIAVAPDYRRRGIFTALGEAAHHAWKEAGVAFVIGLPNDQWGTRREHLGCQNAFPAVWLWRPLREDALAARAPEWLRGTAAAILDPLIAVWNGASDARLLQSARGIDVLTVEEPGKEFDRLWTVVGARHEALVVRDRTWLAHRYAAGSGRGYRLMLAQRDGIPVGSLAYRVDRSSDRTVGWIADLFTDPADHAAGAALLYHALRAMHLNGIETVRALVPAGAPVRGAFRRAGFMRRRGGFGVIFIPLARSLPRAVLSDPHRFFIMGGDFDVV